MKKRCGSGLALALWAGAAWAVGCGDDAIFRDMDAGAFDASPSPDGGASGPSDAAADGDGSAPLGCGDTTGAPPRLLLSMNLTTSSELAAINLTTNAVDGRLSFPSFLGRTSVTSADPYLLEQATDLVARLDPKRPWEVLSSWNVAGDDRPDGGKAYADPAAVVTPSCEKAYVLRFNRDKIAVLDTTAVVEAGAPARFIDLSPLAQPNDTDGIVEMTSAVWVPARKLVYVLLGDIDIPSVALDGYTALCADTHPAITAIDPATDQIVSLGGEGPGGAILLDGYNPPLGAPLAYDTEHDRLLVLEAGCNLDAGGGAAGAIARRRVESVDLATGEVTTLLSLDDKGFPLGLSYIDGTSAAIAFFGQAFLWDPSTPSLGAEIPGGFDALAYDGQGALVGARAATLPDGGRSVVVERVPLTDAGALDAASIEPVATDPFVDNSGFVGGADVWPRR